MAASSDQAPMSVLQKIKKYAAPLNTMSEGERNDMARLVEAGKELLQHQAQVHIKAAGTSPVLISYSSDATPVQHRHRITLGGCRAQWPVQEAGEGHIRVLGGAGLCQVDRWARTPPHTRAILREPFELTHGKGGDPTFSCGQAFVPVARDLGHIGISIAHYCFDGARHAVLTRRVKEYHICMGVGAQGRSAASSIGGH